MYPLTSGYYKKPISENAEGTYLNKIDKFNQYQTNNEIKILKKEVLSLKTEVAKLKQEIKKIK